MKTRNFISLFFPGPNADGKFFIGLHEKITIPLGFSLLVDDVGNNLVDDLGNELVAMD